MKRISFIVKNLKKYLDLEYHRSKIWEAMKKRIKEGRFVSELVIRKRLERLEESLKRLKGKQKISLGEFLRNWEIQDIV